MSIASSPVLYGLAVYTVFNAAWVPDIGQLYVFRLWDHWARLCRSTAIMGFSDFGAGYPWERFRDIMLELLRRNDIHESVLVRATVFIDEVLCGARIQGLRNGFSAFAYPLGRFYSPEGIHVCVSSWSRVADSAIPARAKVNGSYANAGLMKNEAVLNGYDEAIALDSRGNVTEATVANVFLVRAKRLITPDDASGILEGITRDSVMKLARCLDVEVEVRQIERSELYVADEAFLCGSSARIAPILSIDRRPVGDGKPGNMTSRLADLYCGVQLGRRGEFEGWLTPVY